MKTIFVLLLTLATQLAFAQAKDGEYAMAGPGVVSCGVFLQEIEKNDELSTSLFVSWAQGYLTAINVIRQRSGRGMVHIPASQVILGAMVSFCKKNESQPVLLPVIALGRDLDQLPVPAPTKPASQP